MIRNTNGIFMVIHVLRMWWVFKEKICNVISKQANLLYFVEQIAYLS